MSNFLTGKAYSFLKDKINAMAELDGKSGLFTALSLIFGITSLFAFAYNYEAILQTIYNSRIDPTIPAVGVLLFILIGITSIFGNAKRLFSKKEQANSAKPASWTKPVVSNNEPYKSFFRLARGTKSGLKEFCIDEVYQLYIVGQNLYQLLKEEESKNDLLDLIKRKNIELTLILSPYSFYNFIGSLPEGHRFQAVGQGHYRESVNNIIKMYNDLDEITRRKFIVFAHEDAISPSFILRVTDPSREPERTALAVVLKPVTDGDYLNRFTLLSEIDEALSASASLKNSEAHRQHQQLTHDFIAQVERMAYHPTYCLRQMCVSADAPEPDRYVSRKCEREGLRRPKCLSVLM